MVYNHNTMQACMGRVWLLLVYMNKPTLLWCSSMYTCAPHHMCLHVTRHCSPAAALLCQHMPFLSPGLCTAPLWDVYQSLGPCRLPAGTHILAHLSF